MHAETTKAMGTKLVLFDIDGTLMITKGASSRCMKRAGTIVIGPTFNWSPITVGTLDPQIFDQLSFANGIAPTDELRQQYKDAYLSELEQELHKRVEDITVMPGIELLIDSLYQRAETQEDVVLGVLTGNFRRATELKLSLSGLGLDRFRVIICAEDGQTRDDLPQIAMRQAEQRTDRPITPSNTYIVGDTPRDIQCAQANDCQCISVATGRYSQQQLAEAGGRCVFASLADTDAVMAIFDR